MRERRDVLVVENLLTQAQKDAICNTIIDRCTWYQRREEEDEKIYYAPYTHMRVKHSVTAAVISAFAPGHLSIEGLETRDLNYGSHDGLCQPELRCGSGIFHIYSNGSKLKGKRITELCKAMNVDALTTPVFFFIVVFVSDKGVFDKIEIRLPNDAGKIIEKCVLYKGQ